MSRWSRVLIAVSILVGIAAPVFGEVKITVLAGAGGYVRTHAMTAVQVLLENDETDRDGRVAVAFAGMGGASVRATRALALPPGSRKSLFLYLPTPSLADQIIVRYETPRGRKISELKEPIRPLSCDVPVLGVVGISPGGLPPDEDGDRKRYRRLMPQPDQLPTRHEGLEMYDAMLIAPLPPIPISRDRTLALRDWVLRGGSLVLDVSRRTQALSQGVFVEMLPFFPLAGQQGVLDVFGQEVLFTTGKVRQGEVLLESNGHPLVVRRSYGLGTVTCFAFDPSLPAFARWPGREAVWQEALSGLHLAAPRKTEEDAFAAGVGFAQQQVAQALAKLVFHAPGTGVRLRLVLLLTGLYALIVGPGDYFLVKRLGKPNLTWVTFPAIVTLFTVGAYVGAKNWIGGETHASNTRRTLILPDRGLALRYDVAGLFVSAGRDYRIREANGALLRHIGEAYGVSDRLEMDQDSGVLTHRIPIWTHRVYGISQTTTAFPRIDLRLAHEDGMPVATVTNNSDLTLRRNQIAYGDSLWDVGATEIKPGESVSVRLDPAQRAHTGILSGRRGPTGILSGLSRFTDYPVTLIREFDARPALQRGGVLFLCRDAGEVTCPLIVDGTARPESGEHLIQVLTFAASPTPRTAEETSL